MTNLQQAAQAVIDRWNAPACELQQHTAEYIYEMLQKALDAEQAQTVESYPTKAAFETLKRFEETCADGEGYDIPKKTMRILQAIGLVYRTYQDTYVITDFGDLLLEKGGPLYLHPPQQVAVTSGERAELIEQLNKYSTGDEFQRAIEKAADMLEADVSLINEGNKAQQAKQVPMTDDDIDAICMYFDGDYRVLRKFARAIEKHHGIGGET